MKTLLKEVSDRTFGVMDGDGYVISCTDVSMTGEHWADAVVRVAGAAEGVSKANMAQLAFSKVMGDGISLIGFQEILGRELGIEVTSIKEIAGVKIAKNNPAGLNKISGSIYQETAASGEPLSEADGETFTISKIHQGYLEMSNASVVKEMVNMITISRQYESNQKMLTTFDDTLEKSMALSKV